MVASARRKLTRERRSSKLIEVAKPLFQLHRVPRLALNRMMAGLAITILTALQAQAAEPLGPVSEIGVNDFRISQIGVDGDPGFDVHDPAVAYNPGTNEYLVIWSARPDFCCPPDPQLFGQLLDATTGAEVGVDDFTNESSDAEDASLVYNPTQDEYFVVWTQPDENLPNEIFGRRLDTSGVAVGPILQISQTGAGDPWIAYNSVDDEYLVVWDGPGNVYGQRLDVSGAEIGADFQISFVVPGDSSNQAARPHVVHNPDDNEYLVVWTNNTSLASTFEEEAWGQRVGASGVLLGGEIQVSDIGAPGDDGPVVTDARAAYSTLDNGYLVAFKASGKGPRQVYGQLLDAAGVEIGTNDFQISDIGASGSTTADAVAIAYNELSGQYTVVWTHESVSSGTDVFARSIDATTGNRLGSDLRVSDMGPAGNDNFHANKPEIAYGSVDNSFLVVWFGNEGTDPLHDDEEEVWGQLLSDSEDLDTTGPMISNVSVTPPSGPPGTMFDVEATITDTSGVGGASVILKNSIGTEVLTVPMAASGGDLFTVTLLSDGVPEDTYSLDIEAVDASANANVNRAIDAASIVIGTGIPCGDVFNLRARCRVIGGNNAIQARVTFTDASHDGETVTLSLGGLEQDLFVAGTRAQTQVVGFGSGSHSVELLDPAACVPQVVVTCP